jgi:hypothetical protein
MSKLDKVVSFKKLSETEPKPVKWLIEGILPKCAITTLGAPKKSFKTYLSIYASLCLSEGTDFLGQYHCEKCNILYLDEESGQDETTRRVCRICEGNNIEFNDEKGFYIADSKIKIDDSNDVKMLENFVKEHNIELVVLDTFPRFYNITDENSATSMMKVTSSLKGICNNTGVSFLLITHFKKSAMKEAKVTNTEIDADDIRGSGEIGNVSDNLFIIKREDKTKTEIELINTDSRLSKEIEPIHVVLNFDDKTDAKSVRFSEIPLSLLIPKIQTKVQKFIDYTIVEFDKEIIFNDVYSKQFYWHELKSLLKNKFGKGVNDNEIRQTLENLMKDGRIDKIGHGLYRYWKKGYNMKKAMDEIMSLPISEDESEESENDDKEKIEKENILEEIKENKEEFVSPIPKEINGEKKKFKSFDEIITEMKTKSNSKTTNAQ